MFAPDRRRRRARPRTVAGVVLVAFLIALVVGALTRVGSVSDPYWRSVDRSYAAQGRVLVDRSNHGAVQLHSLLAGWSHASRRSLQEQLDVLVRTAARTARAAAALTPPAPWGDLGARFSSVLADRARAVGDLRRTVDGLLGMAPLPLATAGGTTPATASVDAQATALSASQATTAVAAVGARLERADRTYAAVRHAFAQAPGSARLPASRWVTDHATWAQGPVQTLVQQLAGSPQLAPVHQVVLVPSAIAVTPAPLPSSGKGGAASSLLPPTHSLGITAVVADDGNVPEHDLVVTASVQATGGGASEQHSAKVSLAAGASTAVQLPRLTVRPGTTYQLQVSVNPPKGEAPNLTTSRTFTIEVAPSASPPPTTTPTSAPTSTSGGSHGSG